MNNNFTHIRHMLNAAYPLRLGVSHVGLHTNYIVVFVALILIVLLTVSLNLTAILTFLLSKRFEKFSMLFSYIPPTLILIFWQILPAIFILDVDCSVLHVQRVSHCMFIGSSVTVFLHEYRKIFGHRIPNVPYRRNVTKTKLKTCSYWLFVFLC